MDVMLSVQVCTFLRRRRPGFSELATSAGDGKDAVFLDAFAAFRDEVHMGMLYLLSYMSCERVHHS